MSDIATRAGVSPTTVSFVLNDRHTDLRISEKTRNKVLQAAEELGYRSNHLARAMRTGNTRMLASFGGDSGQEQVGCMLAGALAEAEARGYTLKILRSDSLGDNNDAQQVIRRCSELRLMGVIALHLPVETLAKLHTEARRYGYPLVLMDARSENAELPQVISDDAAGIALGVEHLVKLGHRKIAFISGEVYSTLTSLRENAFVAAMKQQGVEVPANYVTRGDYQFREPSVEAACALLQLPPAERPTAIFAAGDLIAMTVIQVAHDLQIAVPKELSVIGFANMRAAEFTTPALTTIEQPFREIGQVAARLLLDVIEEKSEEEAASNGERGLSNGGASNGNSNRSYNSHYNGNAPKGAESSQVKKTSAPDRQAVQILPTRLIERRSTAPPPV